MPIVHYPELVFQEHPYRHPNQVQFRDLTDKVFGRLSVIGFAGHLNEKTQWYCLCECGNLTRTPSETLNRGLGRSCGCLASERKKAHGVTHGNSRRGTRTAEYDTWCTMRRRCHDPKYAHFGSYGARGITVCPRWRYSFEAFLADMGKRPSPKHSIDRVNNDGNYEPDNCRWATKTEQAQNMSTNFNVDFNGKTLCLSQWARELGVPRGTIAYRLRRGWPVEKAFAF